MDLDRLKKNFDILKDWQDRYRFIIEMGTKISKLPSAAKIEENRVHGCMSTVHMIIDQSSSDEKVHFIAESDASIVNGLIAILHVIYDDKTPDQIRAVDIKEIFHQLGLDGHISPNRRNGFFSMVERLQTLTSKE